VLNHAAAFAKTQRLLKPAEFKRVFELRQSAHNTHFGIYAAKNTSGQPRVGLVVSKKVSKKAVVRNRIKRQIRENFRLQQAPFGAHDFVVVAKAPLAAIAFDTITPQLQPLWAKAIKRCKR
jgi:ribonuclease P protein component